MKPIVLAVALAFALSGTALAGDIHTTDAPAPQPRPVGTAVAGDVHSTDAPSPQASTSVLAKVLLTVISIVVR